MLKQRKPMSRGKGFKRPDRPHREPAPLRRVERAGVYASAAGPASQIPKSEPLRNRRLLDLARGMPCLLRIPGVCNGDVTTTVACHSNWGVHGKAGARKADDCYVVFGCSACHRWLDQGPSNEAVKWKAFDAALIEQWNWWTRISVDPAWSEADRRAAQWALDHLVRLKPGVA
jgi:hypothetical protein